MKKIVLAFALTLLLTAGLMPVNVVHAAAASLSVFGGTSLTIRGGEDTTIPIVISNSGDADAEDVYMTVFSSTLLKAEVQGAASSIKIKKGETSNFVVVVRAEDKNATHDLEITLAYKDNGKDAAARETLKVRATSDTPAPSAQGMPNITMTEPSGLVTIEAGKDKVVDVVLYNNSANYASKFLAALSPNQNLSASFVDKTNEISTFSARDEKTVQVKISVPSDLQAGSYLVQMPYTYMGAGNTSLSGSASFYVRVTGKADEKTHLIIDNYSAPNMVKAGDVFSISAEITNTAGTQAKNVQVALSGLSSDGLMVSNAAASQYLQTINGGAKKGFSFSLQSSKNLTTGAYPLKLLLTYTDEAGAPFTAEYNYFVNIVNDEVASSENKAVIEVTSMSNPTAAYEVGQQIPIKLTLKNTGLAAASNIKVTAATDAAIVPSSANIKQVRSLAAGESTEVSFSFMAGASSKTQNYTIGFTVEYETGVTSTAGAREKESFVQYTGVNIDNPDNKEQTSSRSIPKIIVSKYSVTPETVAAGKEFDLNISFQNTHSKKTISNIRVSFAVNGTETEKGNVFTPVESSNMFYIEQMEPKEVSEHKLRLFTVQDAKPKNYVITIRFEYEDEEGTPYDSTVEVGVNVKQETKLDIGDISLPQSMSMGDMFGISFIVHNTGKVTLSNLKVKIEGEGFDTAGTEYIFGNFTSGSHDYYDAMLSARMPGTQTGRIVISFDDDMGEHKEIIRDFTMEVFEPVYFDPGMDKFPGGDRMDMNPQNETFFGKVLGFAAKFWYLFAIGVIAVAAVIILLIRRHVKKIRLKKLDELDE